MSVITSDILLTGIRRDDVFAWLSDPGNHERILAGAFNDISLTGEGTWKLSYKGPAKTRTLGYHFKGPDDSHGGRRIICETTGKRTAGELHYSLRTMKPSSNTLVTIHMDYSPGSLLGAMLDSAGLQQALEGSWKRVLENLSREIPRSS